jgi:hypothetical protein
LDAAAKEAPAPAKSNPSVASSGDRAADAPAEPQKQQPAKRGGKQQAPQERAGKAGKGGALGWQAGAQQDTASAPSSDAAAAKPVVKAPAAALVKVPAAPVVKAEAEDKPQAGQQTAANPATAAAVDSSKPAAKPAKGKPAALGKQLAAAAAESSKPAVKAEATKAEANSKAGTSKRAGAAAPAGGGSGGGGALNKVAAKPLKIPRLPMVRHARKWYRCRVAKDAGDKVLMGAQAGC